MLATIERAFTPGFHAPALTRRAAPSPVPAPAAADEFGRAVAASVVTGAGLTFTLDVPGAGDVIPLATPIRTWLLAARMSAGGVSATVAPSFFSDTYPAMLALVRALNDAGLGALWRPDGVRTVRLDQAVHVFVSADRPVAERTPAPGALLEVVEGHRIGADWYAARVAPRAAAPGLTRVFYGRPGAEGSVYDLVRREAVAAEAHDGIKRLFSSLETSAIRRGRRWRGRSASDGPSLHPAAFRPWRTDTGKGPGSNQGHTPLADQLE